MKELCRSVILVLLGTLIFAIALTSINIPNKLGEGGVTGLTLLFYYVFHFNPAISNMVLNVGVIALGWKFLDRKTIYYTLLSVLSLSFYLQFVHLPVFMPTNTLLAAVTSGVLVGGGIGLVIYGGGTTSGSDIIAMIANKFFGISIPIALLIIDCIIVIPLTFAIGLEKGVLTIITLYVTSKVMHFILDGSNPKRAFLIISERHEEIAQEISAKIGRGITVFQAFGHFTKTEKQPLYVVVNHLQIVPTQKIIHEIDPRAFVTITSIQQVLGEGFSWFEK